MAPSESPLYFIDNVHVKQSRLAPSPLSNDRRHLPKTVRCDALHLQKLSYHTALSFLR